MKTVEIALACPEYCSVAEAQYFGISFLNNADSLDNPDCRFCINWHNGGCEIYLRSVGVYKSH